MSITREELSDFNRFAEDRLSDGAVDTLYELVDEWNHVRSHQQSVARIRESARQHEAGQSVPVDEAFDEVRRKLDRAS
jgi:hypothetical protein